MIPISLTISNFMPYKSNVPTINFAGIHVATICGDNGSGKSSIIDAMTWALWGKTRARSDDDLVHQGEFNMQVQFDFAVSDQTYRVIRKHARPKTRRASGQSSLDLFVSNHGSFRPISADRLSETEKKIAEILHMDYDTFVNSAFLRQGHADEFTVAKPAERKTVLTNILGLATYDRLEMQARQSAAVRESSRIQAETAIKDIDVELAQKPGFEAELAGAEERLKGIEIAMSQLEGQIARLRQDRELLRAKRQQLGQLEEQISSSLKAIGRWSNQAKQGQLRVDEYERLLSERASIEDKYAMLVSHRKQNDELNQKLRLVKTLQDRQHQLELAVLKGSQSLLAEHTIVANRISELESKSKQAASLRNDLSRLRTELDKAAEREESLASARQEMQRRHLEIRQLEAEKLRANTEIAEIDEKLHLLTSGGSSKCPLCEQDLGLEHLELIKQKYAQDRKERADRDTSLASGLAQLKAELARQEKEQAAAETAASKAHGELKVRSGITERELNEAEEAGKQLEAENAKLAALEERLAKKEYAPAEQEEQRRIEQRIALLEYDAEQHERVRREAADLERFEAPKHRLDEATRQVDHEKETVSASLLAAREIEVSLETYTSRKKSLTIEIEAMPPVDQQLSTAEAEYQEIASRRKVATETLGSAREKLNRCAKLDALRIEKEKLFRASAEEEGIYRDLAEAFGKRGVQALLIEIALPEIESEANRLLGRMTDNRMHVKFETQRETKKGDILETLDINIADELGTRSYEMFSGGEAFRINFAIRIALSKVLARRAGAPLPTLIIDEGFGTQDTNGMEKLKEAITSVQDDFEKILVISHIEDFKDAFPVRIDVVKTPEGSTVEVG